MLAATSGQPDAAPQRRPRRPHGGGVARTRPRAHAARPRATHPDHHQVSCRLAIGGHPRPASQRRASSSTRRASSRSRPSYWQSSSQTVCRLALLWYTSRAHTHTREGGREGHTHTRAHARARACHTCARFLRTHARACTRTTSILCGRLMPHAGPGGTPSLLLERGARYESLNHVRRTHAHAHTQTHTTTVARAGCTVTL